MSKVKASFFIIIVLMMFIISIYFNNTKILVIELYSPNKNILTTKLYYNIPYSEKRVLTPYKIKDNKYYYDISKINLNAIRFDPEINSDINITIKSIQAIKKVWFKKSLYEIPLKYTKPLSGIIGFRLNDVINFKTTDNDPQLEIKPNFKLISKDSLIYLDKLIFFMAITAILFYLYHIYRFYKIDNNLIAKIILYSIFLFFIIFKAFYYKEKVHYGYPPDERAHMIYIKYVNTHHDFVTNFKELPIYLSHPPLYYEMENLVFDKIGSLSDNVSNFRNLSVAIFSLAIVLILYLGFSAKFSILGDFTFLSLISSLPMLSYIGGSISNDNLALLGVSIFLIGFKRLFDNRVDNIAFLLIGLGGAIAYFSKLTAALLIFFALIYYIIFIGRKEFLSKIRLSHIMILFVFLLPVIYYQIAIILEYHKIVPTYDVTHPSVFKESVFYVAPENRLHLTPKEWFFRMIHYIQSGWFAIHSHHSFGHSTWFGVIGLVLLHILAILALFFKCNSKAVCYFGKIVLLGLFSVEFIQYIFSYKAHITNGYMGGLQPRYLLPFMVGFAIMAAIFVEKFKKYFWWNIFVIVICIQAIYSDFFYFLLYYK